MSYRPDEPGYRRRDVITIPILWLWIAASLLVHVVALFLLVPDLNMQPLENTQLSETQDKIEVQLTRPPSPPPAPPSAATPPPQAVIVPPARPPRTPPARPSPRPPVITAPPRPSPPATPALPPTPPVVAQQPPPPMTGDLSAYIEARKRERGETTTPPEANSAAGTAPPAESGSGHLNESLAANLPSAQSPIDGRDRKKGGGIFQIKSMAYDDAEFEFYGWNNDVDRKTIQRIEVRKGNNSDMRIAVVRRMIAIIRLHAQADFTWESQRLGKNVTLSARAGDNDALEAFLMQEFFEDNRVR